jgi:hypothetical protein
VSPKEVRTWPYEDFEHACMILEAEQGYKVTSEEIEENKENRGRTPKDYILDYHVSYFTDRTTDELLNSGFNPDQLLYVEEELSKRGLRYKQ